MPANPAALLKSFKPEDRKRGIKLIAQRQDEKALRVLMKVYKQDEDPEVRAYAKRGAAAVAKRIKAQQSEDDYGYDDDASYDDVEEEESYYEEPASATPTKVEVNERDERRAKSLINEAMDHHMNNDRAKGMKALTKALETNPNLRSDAYFTSVAGEVTGLSPLEAITALENPIRRQIIQQADRKDKNDARVATHMDKVGKHTWGTLLIDLGLLSFILFMGGFLSVLVYDYGATNRIDRLNEQIDSLVAAAPETEEATLLRDELLNYFQTQRTATLTIAEGFNPGTGLLVGAAVLLSIIPSLLIFGVVLQPVAVRILKGNGSAPYGIYNLIYAYILPSLISFAVLIFGGIIVFIMGVPISIGLLVVGGLTNLIQLFLVIRILGAISKSYDIDFIKAFIAALIAGIPSGIVSSVIIGIMFGIVGAVFVTIFNAAI
jgi:hypothetical protein